MPSFWQFRKPRTHLPDVKSQHPHFFSPQVLEKALYAAFLACDRSVKASQDANPEGDRSGSTAVASFVTPTHVVLAHAGDSRAVLASGQQVLISSLLCCIALCLLCLCLECPAGTCLHMCRARPKGGG